MLSINLNSIFSFNLEELKNNNNTNNYYTGYLTIFYYDEDITDLRIKDIDNEKEGLALKNSLDQNGYVLYKEIKKNNYCLKSIKIESKIDNNKNINIMKSIYNALVNKLPQKDIIKNYNCY